MASSPTAKAPGYALTAYNLEALSAGGYRRTLGYDRFDGHPRPSRNRGYLSVPIVPGSPIVSHAPLAAATWSGGSGVLLLRDGDTLKIGCLDDDAEIPSGSSIVIDGVTYTASRDSGRSSRTRAAHQDAEAAAANWRRGMISAVPGQGPVRGVVAINDTIFAFRDQADDRGGMFMATASGWIPVTDLGSVATISTASGIEDGDVTLTRSGVTVSCVAQLNAEGTSGALIVEPGKTVAVNDVLTATGATCKVTAVTPVTIAPGGRYQAVVHNFFGGVGSRAAYVASGVQRAFELRESGWVIPIHAVDDVAQDKPHLAEVHADHLFLAFPGGQYQHSGPSNPMTWSGLLGAEAFAVGDEITGLKSTAGGVLLVTCRNKILGLYGASSTDWAQKVLSEAIGIQIDTLQNTFVPVGLSDRGLVRIDRVQEFGDFALNLLDQKKLLSPIIEQGEWLGSTQVAASNQLRLFSARGDNVAITLLADGTPMATTFRYASRVIGCWRYDEHDERVFFALDGQPGMVFELDEESCSFDGEPISWRLRLPFAHCGSPSLVKSWVSAIFEQTTPIPVEVDVRWSVDHMLGSQFSSRRQGAVIGEDQSAIWNESRWNQFYWGGGNTSSREPIGLTGSSTSISMAIGGESDRAINFTLTGLTINYFPRRARRD